MANIKQVTVLKNGLAPVFHWNNVAPSASTKLSFPDPKHFVCSLVLNTAWYVKNIIASLRFTKSYKAQLNSRIDVTTTSTIYNVNINYLSNIISQIKSMQSNQEIIKSRPT